MASILSRPQYVKLSKCRGRRPRRIFWNKMCYWWKRIWKLWVYELSNTLGSLHWRHDEHDGVSNYQPHDCLLNRLFRCRSKKHQSSASPAFVCGIHRWPVNSPHKRPVTRKIFPFDDVIIMQKSAPKIKFVSRIYLERLILELHTESGSVNSTSPGQNGRHFADDILWCIFVNENFYILIKISLKFVPKGPIDNNPALV